MKEIYVNNIRVSVLTSHANDEIIEQLEKLLENHRYNLSTDWDEYRKTRMKWKQRKIMTS